ncbi:MAG: FAD-binding oxidoreductase, partial [Paracoccaceae bacterium]
DFGLDSRLLSAREASALIPDAAPGLWQGALHTPSDARAEPFVAVPMMAAALRDRGGHVVEGCAVRALDIQAGRVVGVVTEAGRIRADAVVLTGGAWSSLLLRRHGVGLPQLSVLSSVAATEPGPAFFPGALADSDFAIRRRADGGYTLAPGSSHRFFIGPDAFRHLSAFRALVKDSWRSTGFRPMAPRGYPDAWSTPRQWPEDGPSPFEALRILNPEPDRAALERARQAMRRAFPGQAEPRLRLTWAGMIDTMPDVVPVLDHVDALPGLVLGTGLSGHGFGIGPAIGRVLADLVTGRAGGHDLSRFRMARFRDGSAIAPGPAL